jgi:hypothetical protein
MDYYLLPLEKEEVKKFEYELRKIDYDVDDRVLFWNAEDIDRIVNSMTKENAYKMMSFCQMQVQVNFLNYLKLKKSRFLFDQHDIKKTIIWRIL